MPEVHSSDLLKLRDTLDAAFRHHHARDESNAALHLAPMTRSSPLTSQLGAELDRVKAILADNNII